MRNLARILISSLLIFCVTSKLTYHEQEAISYRQEVDLKNALLNSDESEQNENHIRQVSTRSCPSDCSGHGVCVNGYCSCSYGYTGADCSIAQVALTNGVTLTNQSVSTFTWKFYTIAQTSGAHDVTFNVVQVGRGDCDEYVQLNSLPTRSAYVKRDISTNNNVTLTITNAQSGTWYLGVYGFQTCNFAVSGFISGACPNRCSGFGTCINGACRCNEGYAGADCSKHVTSMVVGTTYTGAVTRTNYNYYTYNFQSGNLLQFTLSQQSGSGDCDLYLKLNAIPSVVVWDYANVTAATNTIISVTDPQFGLWYLAVFGYSTCSYSLTISTGAVCPNQCSQRGQCNQNSVCSCPSGYSGDYCQTRTTPLTDGATDNGYVSTNTWNYYTYVSNSADNFVIAIDQNTAQNSDCDVYVKNGAQPTRWNYDFQNIASNVEEFNVTVTDPGQSTWYIGVYGWSTCLYSIATYESSSCPNNCNGRGSCAAGGQCICNDGYTGVACEYTLTTLANGVMTTGTVTYNSWTFYSFAVTGSSMYIVVEETASTGLAWVYAAQGYPTVRQYLYADLTSNNALHVISVESSTPTNSTLQIGVYGNPYLLQTQSASYQIIAWTPDF